MVEYSSSLEPPVMVARGVLHGCIGVCCTAKYPSVFANIGDKDIWNFVQEKAIKINVDHTEKKQNIADHTEKNKEKIIDEEKSTNVTGIVIGIVFLILVLIVFLFIYINKCKKPKILSRV